MTEIVAFQIPLLSVCKLSDTLEVSVRQISQSKTSYTKKFLIRIKNNFHLNILVLDLH